MKRMPEYVDPWENSWLRVLKPLDADSSWQPPEQELKLAQERAAYREELEHRQRAEA
jgi:hypothetical protein